MKQFFTLSFFLASYCITLAGPLEARLSISMLSSSPVKVVIDGRIVRNAASGDRDIVFTNLRPGIHRVEVLQPGGGRYQQGGNSGRTLFSGTVRLKPGIHTDITINRFGRSYMDEQPIGRGFGDDCYQYGNHGQGYGFPATVAAMSQKDFELLLSSLGKIPFEDTRTSTARTAVSKQHLSSRQVVQLLDGFSFETNKLELAKYCYSRTTDPENYFLIYDSFSFDSSRDALNDFISR